MKFRIAIVSLILLGGCRNPKNNDSLGFQVEIDRVFINYYENDSLNKARIYVIPRIYYDFNVVNSSSDSVTVLLNTHFNRDADEPPYLYICFEYSGVKNTLLLTEYESINPLIFTPNSVDGFIVGIPISEFLENDLYKHESELSFMKYVANHGVVHYSNPYPEENKKILSSQTIRKSKNFEIEFRDLDDTAVE